MPKITSTSKKNIRSLALPGSGMRLTYEWERKSVKNLNLRVRRDGTIHLSVPTRTTVAEAERFLSEHETWLIEAIGRMERRAEIHPTDIGDTLPYLGGQLHIQWVKAESAEVRADLEHRQLTIHLPDPTDAAMRRAAVEVFERAETEHLVRALVDRYYPLFEKRGVAYPAHIRVKSLKSRHGSCAPGTGSLNFALRLCELPLPFVEYVVVHELCHFLVPNHSVAFWREVERILPDRRAREAMGKQ